MSTLGTLARLILTGSVQAAHVLVVAVASLCGYVYAVIAWPFATTATVLFFLLSPVIYPVTYAFKPFFWLASLVPKIEVRDTATHLYSND